MAKDLSNFRQGDTKKIKIDYGTGFDVTGYKFWFTLRNNFGDVTFVAQASTTAGDNPLDDIANGLVWLFLESDVSKLIATGKYFWDVQRAIPGTPPDVLTLIPLEKNLKDKISVLDHVTKVDT